MANAAVNILGDGSILDVTTLGGDVAKLETSCVEQGLYELHGTFGMVPPPYGWGVVTNPVDKLSTLVSYTEGVLRLDVRDEEGEPVAIPSMVTLHIVIADAPQIEMPANPSAGAKASAELARLRGVAGEVIQRAEDLIDIGESNPDIERQILEWKRYRVALSRIEDQSGYPDSVEWPGMPN